MGVGGYVGVRGYVGVGGYVGVRGRVGVGVGRRVGVGGRTAVVERAAVVGRDGASHFARASSDAQSMSIFWPSVGFTRAMVPAGTSITYFARRFEL